MDRNIGKHYLWVICVILKFTLLTAKVTAHSDINLVLEKILQNNKIVTENSDVFIQLGKFLFNNSSEPFKKQTKRTIEKTHNGHGSNRKNVIKEMPGYAAWPYIYLPQANSTLSNIMKTPGYIKREGRPVVLSQSTLDRLRGAVATVGKAHNPQDRTKWETMNFYKDKKLPAYKRWHNKISRHDLYPPDQPELINDVMYSLVHSPITLTEDNGNKGSQVKFIVHLADGSRALIKPIRFTREIESWPNHYYFPDHERHTAEIAAFQLDRLINFRRVPPVAGRMINITRDIFEVGEKLIKEEFFMSPAGNLCYRGGCNYYCDLHHLTCGRPEMLEVSMMAFLPTRAKVKRTSWEHPWKKSYSIHSRAKFEDKDTCPDVRRRPEYHTGRRFLDVMDTCVFDFLTGNTDRHHFNTFSNWDNFTASIHIDNGKGFGCSHEDELINLLPIKQCCTIRFTTLRTLLQYHDAPVSLGQALKASLESDVLAPVLLDPHYDAVDRRAYLILQTIADCLKDTDDITTVIVDDGF